MPLPDARPCTAIQATAVLPTTVDFHWLLEPEALPHHPWLRDLLLSLGVSVLLIAAVLVVVSLLTLSLVPV